MDACVTESERSRGVGRLLIEAVKTWAEERRLDYVELNVLSNNRRAIALYEREGFTEEMRTMRCKLKRTAEAVLLCQMISTTSRSLPATRNLTSKSAKPNP